MNTHIGRLVFELVGNHSQSGFARTTMNVSDLRVHSTSKGEHRVGSTHGDAVPLSSENNSCSQMDVD
jgi:hypothetical protein